MYVVQMQLVSGKVEIHRFADMAKACEVWENTFARYGNHPDIVMLSVIDETDGCEDPVLRSCVNELPADEPVVVEESR